MPDHEGEMVRLMATVIEEAKVTKAQRRLEKWALRLHRNGSLYVVADQIGPVRGAPFNGSIDDVLSWIESRERS
jgi:hypothetical protein